MTVIRIKFPEWRYTCLLGLLSQNHRLGGLNNRIFLTVLRSRNPRSVSRFGFCKGLSAWFKWPPSHCLHMTLSVWVQIPGISSSSYKNISHIGLRHTLITLFNFNYLFKSLFSKYSHILRYKGLQHVNFRET